MLRPVYCAALIVVAVVLVWSNSLSAPFQLDDHESIVANPTIRDFASFRWLFPPATGGETASGRPVLNLSFALNHAFGGLDVRGYRATNIFIHALAAMTLFGVVRRTLARRGGPATGMSLAVALLWAVHPLQTAAVTYIVQRAESLAACFYLLTLYGFIRSTEATPGAPRWAIASMLACLLGSGTKETVATAPLVVLLYDRTFIAGSFRAAWHARWRTHLALAATWLPLAFLVIANEARGGSAGFASLDAPTYFVTQCHAIARYLALAVWPAGLVFDYGMVVVERVGDVLPEMVLLLVLGGATLWALRRNHAAGFLGATCFLVLAPSSSFVPVATQTIAEHRMYLALAPILILVCVGLRPIVRRQERWIAAAAILALGTIALARNQIYRSGILLWSDTVAKRPENARAHNNLGLALFAAGRDEEAADAFRRALALNPRHAFAHFNLGLALARTNRFAEARDHFEAVTQIDPAHADAQMNLGDVLVRLDREEEAIAAYERVLQLQPDAADARVALAAVLQKRGIALARAGRVAEALPLLQRVVELQPDDADAHANLGNALLFSGDAAGAVQRYEAALRLRPQDARVRENLASARALLRR